MLKCVKNLNKENIYFTLVLSGIFMWCLCFWRFYDGKSIYLLWGELLLVVVGAFIQKHVNLDIQFLCIFEAFLIGSIFAYREYKEGVYWHGMLVVLAYLLGKLVIGNKKTKLDSRILIVYFVMAFTFALQGISDVVYSWKINYFDTELLMGVLRGGIYPRTQLTWFFILITTSLCWAIIVFKEHRVLSSIIVLLNLIIIPVMIKYEDRYNILFLVISIIITLIVWVYSSWRVLSKWIRAIVISVLITALLTIISLFLAYRLNWFGLNEHLGYTYFATLLDVSNNIRFKVDLEALQLMPDYPYGGYVVYTGILPRAHDSFIEFQRHYGTVVFALIELFRLLSLKDLFLLALKRGSGYRIKYLLIPTVLVLNIYYSMEPIGYHDHWWFAYLVFITAIVRSKLEVEAQGDIQIASIAGKAVIHDVATEA